MIQILKLGVCLVFMLTVAAIACMPTAIQAPSQTIKAAKETSPSSSKINEALAAIALQTSLPSADYRIGPEDLLQFTLYNIQEAEVRNGTGQVVSGGLTPRNIAVRVSQQGLVSLPLIGDVRVAGLTPAGLERELKNQYDKYIYGPQVGVLVLEYRQRVSIIGAVQKPGVVELTGPKTVVEVLALAGGVTDKAGTQVHISHQGLKGRETRVFDLLALANNASLITADGSGLITMPVQPGDVINVPPAGMFFVDGAVGRPGSFPLGRHYSLTQALAIAGGVNPDLYSSDITIFRRKASSGIEPMTVDLNTILAGSASDPKIEEDDVIVVPINSFKYAFFRVFGQLLGWGTSIGAMTAGS